MHQLWFDLRTTEVWTFQSPTPTCFANSAVVYFGFFPLLRETVFPRLFPPPLSWRAHIVPTYAVCISHPTHHPERTIFEAPRNIFRNVFIRRLRFYSIASVHSTAFWKQESSIQFFPLYFELLRSNWKKLLEQKTLQKHSFSIFPPWASFCFTFFGTVKRTQWTLLRSKTSRPARNQISRQTNKQRGRGWGSFEDRGNEIPAGIFSSFEM